jgi:hypothetical protein
MLRGATTLSGREIELILEGNLARIAEASEGEM